ncbi:glutaredoxin 2 [Pycnococcus provasolii]
MMINATARTRAAAQPRRTAIRPTASANNAHVLATRVVPPVLPKIFVYDHCPFCVRVRIALGIKNVKHELIFLANDDVATPTSLVGKKVAPIMLIPGQLVMNESLDIVKYFDERPEYGPTDAIKPKSDREDIKAWQKKVQTLLRLLHRPRYMLSPGFPEFQQADSRDYFVAGHQLPALLPDLNAALWELEQLIYSEYCCTEGGISMDDIDLAARLRSVTLVRGAQFGPKTVAYLKNIEKLADIPMYFKMAL